MRFLTSVPQIRSGSFSIFFSHRLSHFICFLRIVRLFNGVPPIAAICKQNSAIFPSEVFQSFHVAADGTVVNTLDSACHRHQQHCFFIRAYQIVINPVKPIDCRFYLCGQSVVIRWRNKNDHVCFFELRVKTIHAVLKHARLFSHRQVSQPIQGCTHSKAASKRKTVCPLSVAPRTNSSASSADVPCLCGLPVIATIYIVSSRSLQSGLRWESWTKTILCC